MAKRLYEILKPCKKEEEVKSEVAKFFKFKINADGLIDHYSENILWEFKLDKNFKNIKNISVVIAQTMYYVRFLKFGKTNKRIPPHILVIDKNEAFIFETSSYKTYYSNDKYDWDRAASSPDPILVDAIARSKYTSQIHIYNFSILEEENNFINAYNSFNGQLNLVWNTDKKSINEDNFLEVYDYWNKLFGIYVENGRKSSEYFLADIEKNKSIDRNNQIYFDLGDGNVKIKQLPMSDYKHFWSIYDKVESKDIYTLRQKSDRLSQDYKRNFQGEYYTSIDIAKKGWEYFEKIIGKKEWWRTGEYRIWDMAAGTGNLEFNLPESALKYCYISSLLEDDVNYCKKIFSSATCFQYDYLNDDVECLFDNFLKIKPNKKLPQQLQDDLNNKNLKWVIFINPPWGTSQTTSLKKGHDSKYDISKTRIRDLMTMENLKEPSRELFTQFLYRISKEFSNKQAYLCLFSPPKYMNYKNDQKIRDTFFQYEYKKGFLFSMKHFYRANKNNKKKSSDFPAAFAIWDLSKKIHLEKQELLFDVYNLNIEKYATKKIHSINSKRLLNEWIIDKKQKSTQIMPTFSSGITVSINTKDTRAGIKDGFLFCLMSVSPDYQHSGQTTLMSGPYSSAGAYSVTEENFEKAMIIHAVRKSIKRKWTNDKDLYYQANNSKDITDEFINDCVIWSAFSDNNMISLKDVEYKGKTYQIKNNLFPYIIDEIKKWDCTNSDIQVQLSTANEDRFLAKYLQGKKLSKEAVEVYLIGKELHKFFYKELCNIHRKTYKIDNWDTGLWQIKNSIKEITDGKNYLNRLKIANKRLGEKLIPKFYEYGFLYPDIVEFKRTAE